ncbi:MAG: class I SAM-dependent methyltransferase [Oscillospiraceae bacterium]|nr:class I SAM-dependent methyltransferase [Oscillospiraceae bacterium]
MLDKRLSLCAELVSGDYICDIGTDHGYLPAELLFSGKCSRATAADINEKPLEAAKLTFEKYNVSDKAALVLSDGLRNVDTAGVTDIVIAGMGGELISRILENGADKLSPEMNLILQPMTKAPVLRKYLCANGYEIVCERAACDGRFRYNVISARKNGRIMSCSEAAAEVGFMDFSREDEREYALHRISTLEATGREISKSDPVKGEYYYKLTEEIREYVRDHGGDV